MELFDEWSHRRVGEVVTEWNDFKARATAGLKLPEVSTKRTVKATAADTDSIPCPPRPAPSFPTTREETPR